MSSSRPVVFLDLETSAFEPFRREGGERVPFGEILEVGLVVCREEPGLPIVREFEAKVAPEHIETASAQALQVNGFDAEVWAKEGRPLEEVLRDIRPLLHRAQIAGHNVSKFDLGTWMRWAWRCFPATRPLDLGHRLRDSMRSSLLLRDAGRVTSVRLQDMAAYLGIPSQGRAHSALADAKMSREVWLSLSARAGVGDVVVPKGRR